jgi:cation diffusion facilitator family transporter
MTMSPKSRAAAVSVASNSTLVLLKLAVGFLSGSVSIISEAIHSAIDLLASLIAWVSVSKSDKAADAEHPYGHGKVEAISGAIEAALIMVAAIWIVVEAVKKVMRGGETEHLGLGTAVMAVSVVVNILVSRYLFRVARREDSLALEADAHHLSTDVYTSLGVAVGLAIVWGARTFAGTNAFDIVDPIVAIAVALFILKIGVQLTLSSAGHLLDHSLPADELRIIEAILKSHPEVLEWHNLRTRKSGSQRYVEAHVTLRGNLTLSMAHAAALHMEKAINAALPSAQATLHVDPPEALPPHRRPPTAVRQ